jgi:hypothetical protein
VDVVGEGESLKGEDHLSTPTRVVGGRRVQHNEHKGPDVVNLDNLSMKGDDGVGVEPKVWGVSGVTDGGVGLRPRRRCGATAI